MPEPSALCLCKYTSYVKVNKLDLELVFRYANNPFIYYVCILIPLENLIFHFLANTVVGSYVALFYNLRTI